VFAPDVQPAVRLLDADGAPMAGAAVTASVQSGGGDLQGTTTATTDANGVAAFADLGIDGDGAQVIGFSAAGASADANAVDLQPLRPRRPRRVGRAGGVGDHRAAAHGLLPDGKILAWGRKELDGSMGSRGCGIRRSAAPEAWPWRLPRHDAVLRRPCADGRWQLMVSGGHKLDDRGLDVTNIFDPADRDSGCSGCPRWPRAVVSDRDHLADGRLVTVAGKDTAKKVVTIPEVWENDQWVQLPGASLTLPYYPRDFVDPETGLVFMAGERVQSRWLDVDASGPPAGVGGDAGPSHIWGFNRDYGSAVMYDTGKILYVGGGGNTGWDTPDRTSPVPTATAEKIDLMAAGPSWAPAGSMAQPRRHLNATVLPDGTVLVTGGVSGGGFNDLTTRCTPLSSGIRPNPTTGRLWHRMRSIGLPQRVAAAPRRHRPARRERRCQRAGHHDQVPGPAEPRDLPSAVPVPRRASGHQRRADGRDQWLGVPGDHAERRPGDVSAVDPSRRRVTHSFDQSARANTLTSRRRCEA
jgi:hypothetical protein